MIFDDYMTEKFKVIFNYDGINEFNIDNNNIIINILNKQALDKAKHGPRYKFITKNNNDFEVKVNSEFNGMIVTPKSIDNLIIRTASIISTAMNRVFHPTLTDEEITSLIF